MFKRMGMTLGDLCVFSPALTGDYESSIALLQADAECAKVLASLEKSKRDMVIDCFPRPCQSSNDTHGVSPASLTDN